MRVTQDSNVSIAALKALAQGQDNVHIHIHQNAVQVNNGSRQSIPEWMEDTPPMDEQGLFSFIQTLPEPRLDNLISLVYITTLRIFGGNKTRAARWLGVSHRNYYNRKSVFDRGEVDRLEKQKLLVEKVG